MNFHDKNNCEHLKDEIWNAKASIKILRVFLKKFLTIDFLRTFTVF